jgi:hypothetical protein
MSRTVPGLDTTPSRWARLSDELSGYPDGDHSWEQAAVDAACAEHERRAWLATFCVFALLAALAYLALVQSAGFDLGPAPGEHTACEAAGGHETDLLLAHHCEPGDR